MKTKLPILVGVLVFVQSLCAVATHPIQQIAAFHQGDSATGNGSINNIFNRSGLTIGNPNDISTWIHDNAWPNNWQGQGFVNGSADPVGWLVMDLGSSISFLDKMYLWNVKEVPSRGLKDFRVYYSDQPGTLPSFSPNASPVDYLFGAGWNQLGDDHTLAAGSSTGGGFDGIIDLSDIPSAQYIGFEFLTSHNGDINRIGLAEVVVTVPEPSKAILILGGAFLSLGLSRRRDRIS